MIFDIIAITGLIVAQILENIAGGDNRYKLDTLQATNHFINPYSVDPQYLAFVAE